MPVPVTTAMLAFAFLLASTGDGAIDIVSAVIGGLAVLNQLFVSFTVLMREER